MPEDLVAQLAHDVQQRVYGKYRGFVVDNQDPETRGRLRLRIPALLAEEVTGWALPCLPFGGLADQGMFMIPEIDAQVWVEFEAGDLSQPIWTGTFWQQSSDTPAEAAIDPPTTRLLKTPSGILFQCDDAEGEERILLKHPTEAQVEIDKNGTITLTDANGSTLTLEAEAGEVVIEDANGNMMTMNSSGTTLEDSNGNKVEMVASGITVKGQQIVVEGTQVMLAGQGGEPVIKGTSFLTLFATHVHPSAMGPTGPPVPQGEMSSLSSKVTSA